MDSQVETHESLNRNQGLSGIENRLVVAKGEGGEGGMDWEFGISRYRLLYTEWINNKVIP